MKTIIEQVDEFMEGLADGSILFFNAFSNHQQRDHTWVTDMDTRSKTLADTNVEDLNNNISSYLRINDDTKEELAFKIHHSVVILRSLGVIMNNPNTLKDSEFFKERCKQLESENKELLQAYAQAKEKIVSLTDAPKNDFKGFT